MFKNILIGAALGGIVAVTVSACSSNGGVTNSFVAVPQSYQQIELLSRPAVKEAFEVFADHDTTNRTEPYDDPTLKSQIGSFTTTVAGRSSAWAQALQATLYPNEMQVDLSSTATTAAYLGVETKGLTGSTFGGRSLTNDTIDLSLGAIFGNTLTALGVADDGKESPCLETDNLPAAVPAYQVSTSFPYAQPPV